MIWYYIIFPIIYHSVSFRSALAIWEVFVSYIHSCVVTEFSEFVLRELLCKRLSNCLLSPRLNWIIKIILRHTYFTLIPKIIILSFDEISENLMRFLWLLVQPWTKSMFLSSAILIDTIIFSFNIDICALWILQSIW